MVALLCQLRVEGEQEHRGGELHLAFSSKKMDDAPATVKHAERRASGWTDAEPVATGGSPDIALAGDGQLALTYLSADTSQDAPDRNSLFFARSDDGGASWSTPELIERSGYDQPAQSPRLEAVPGSQGLHLAWRKSTSGDLTPEAVFSSYSEDEGSTWTEARQVSFSASGTPSAPEVVVGESGIANTAFQVGGAGASSFPAFFTRCAETACTETEPLFGTSGAGRHIGLAAEDGHHYIALRAIDFEGGQGIYFSMSDDE